MSTQREAIARIEEQLEDVIEHVRRIEKNTAITNGRISSLERWRPAFYDFRCYMRRK